MSIPSAYIRLVVITKCWVNRPHLEALPLIAMLLKILTTRCIVIKVILEVKDLLVIRCMEIRCSRVSKCLVIILKISLDNQTSRVLTNKVCNTKDHKILTTTLHPMQTTKAIRTVEMALLIALVEVCLKVTLLAEIILKEATVFKEIIMVVTVPKEIIMAVMVRKEIIMVVMVLKEVTLIVMVHKVISLVVMVHKEMLLLVLVHREIILVEMITMEINLGAKAITLVTIGQMKISFVETGHRHPWKTTMKWVEICIKTGNPAINSILQ